ncbi:hypothetical protein Ahy_A02g007644 [Arachis hypogaea]|uniref:MULE transposase domain-containing protein n=1 Tax=Arachis hypogaea TaxID=3818 RepID=A0A445ECM2_ARAHY|nr:hypothetical protein Ahy_A02g007644 [Arachis hypogaea]
MTKQPINQSIHCNREGFWASRFKAPIRKNTMTGVGCRARIYAKFDREKHDWVLLKVELNHSHPCSTRKAAHYHENRELTMHAKCIIEINDEAGIRPNNTFLALANEVGGPSNLGFSEKDVRNYISSRLQSTNVNADIKEMLNYFMRMKELNPNYFYTVNINEDNKFTSAVWVDARCRASYKYYGEVVSFDITYSTNRHGLPFAAFIGVNYHGKSTLLSCALLGSKENPSFEWVFTQWLECMETTPKGIITDQCKSMFGAIKKVLPNTRHRWCIWHITQKIHNKLGGYSRFKELNAELKHIIWNSKSVKDFEDHWAEFIDEFNLHHNRWLSVCSRVRQCPRNERAEGTGGRCCRLERDVQTEFGKKVDCTIRAVDEQGNSARVKVKEEILVYETTRYVTFDIHFDRSTHKEFMNCDDEADMLHNVLEDARAKLVDYRGKMQNNTVTTAHNSIITCPSTVFVTEDIQAPSKVTTKGRPKGKRLGYELDKSNQKIHAEKAEECTQESGANQASEASTQQIAKQGLGGFMSLFNSFDNT